MSRLAALDALYARYDGPVPARVRAALDGPVRDCTLDRLALTAVRVLARRRRTGAGADLARLMAHVAACRAMAVAR